MTPYDEKRGIKQLPASSFFRNFTGVNNQVIKEMSRYSEETAEEPEFVIRAYTKAELAQLYNPDLSAEMALQKLYRWMRKNVLLTQALQEAGYNKYRHSFLKREVGLIVHYMGEP